MKTCIHGKTGDEACGWTGDIGPDLDEVDRLVEERGRIAGGPRLSELLPCVPGKREYPPGYGPGAEKQTPIARITAEAFEKWRMEPGDTEGRHVITVGDDRKGGDE